MAGEYGTISVLSSAGAEPTASGRRHKQVKERVNIVKTRSTHTFLAGLAAAAFAVLSPSACEAVSISVASGRISASSKKGYVLLRWNAISGATKYGILRSTSATLNLSNLRKMKFLKTFGKSTRSYKDTSAKLGYK